MLETRDRQSEERYRNRWYGYCVYKDIANCYNVCVQTIGRIAIYKGGVRRGKQMDRNR